MVPSSPSLFLALVALGPSLGAAHPSPEGAPGGTRPSATVSVTADLLPVEEARTSRLVKVITSEELERLGAPTVLEALRRIGGLAYLSYGPHGISHGGMNSSVSIRGMKGGELVLVNGVPIQGASGGAYDLNALKVGQVERVEVLKGAASTLYGADAMSGVINILLKKPAGRQRTLSLEAGNHGHRELHAGLSHDWIQAGFGFSTEGAVDEISLSESKRHRFATGDARTRSWTLGARLAEGLHFDLLGSRQDVTFLQVGFDGRLQKGTRQGQDKHFLDLRYQRGPLQLTAFTSIDLMGRTEFTARTPKELTNRVQNEGLRGVLDLAALAGRPSGSLSLGLDWIQRRADYPDQYRRRERQEMALFLQGRQGIGALEASLGLRGQYIHGEEGAASHRRLLPSLGLTWRTGQALSLFANASQAFRLPTFNHLYYQSSFMVGNPDLRPESGWTYEAGLKADSRRTRTRVGLFRMAYDDKIEVNRTLCPISSYYNAGSYRSEGLEWDLGLSPRDGSDLWLSCNGYWASPSALDPKGQRTQTGPRLQASLALMGSAFTAQWGLGGTLLTGRERHLPSTVLVHARVSRPLGPGQASLKLDNLLDRRVPLLGDFSPGTANRYAYYDLGFTLRASYALTF